MKLIVEKVSGNVPSRQWKIGPLLASMKQGDVILLLFCQSFMTPAQSLLNFLAEIMPTFADRVAGLKVILTISVPTLTRMDRVGGSYLLW